LETAVDIYKKIIGETEQELIGNINDNGYKFDKAKVKEVAQLLRGCEINISFSSLKIDRCDFRCPLGFDAIAYAYSKKSEFFLGIAILYKYDGIIEPDRNNWPITDYFLTCLENNVDRLLIDRIERGCD
jgi:hypothetical protein